tara:strand:- start:1754 stop:2104 length:351 start_codon:yes stop_codon:yes gene_type:complete
MEPETVEVKVEAGSGTEETAEETAEAEDPATGWEAERMVEAVTVVDGSVVVGAERERDWGLWAGVPVEECWEENAEGLTDSEAGREAWAADFQAVTTEVAQEATEAVELVSRIVRV